MKSIKEKAVGYGLLNPDIHYDADGNTYDDVDKPSMDFEAGANYVLEEIENVLNNPYQCTFETLKANIEELVIKLKEK